MRKLVTFLCLLFSLAGFSQSVVPLRGDTIKIYKQGAFAELVLQNKTKDTLGFLQNMGNGRTEFHTVVTGGGTSNGEALVQTFTCTACGFTVGKIVGIDTSSGALVLADTIGARFPIGMISQVIDANTFVVTKKGKVTWTSGLTVAKYEYLSTTAGNLTPISPIVSVYVGQQISTTLFNVELEKPNLLLPPAVDSGIIVGTGLTKSVSGTTIILSASASGLSSFTSPNGSITIGGTLTAPTVDLALAHTNIWTVLQTFNAGINFPASSGTDRELKIINNNLGVNGLADMTIYPSTSGTNIGGALDLIPRGSGYVSSLKFIMRLFNTDFLADASNYEDLAFRSQGSSVPGYIIYSDKLGTGVLRAIGIDASGTGGTQFNLLTNTRVLVNSATDLGFGQLQVWGTANQLGVVYDATHYGFFSTQPSGDFQFGGSSGTTQVNVNNTLLMRGTVTPTLQNALGTAGYSYNAPFFFYRDQTTPNSTHAAWTVKASFKWDSVAYSHTSVTFDSATTVYIEGAPVAAVGNTAITNPYALWIAGGAVGINGTLSEYQVPAVTTVWDAYKAVSLTASTAGNPSYGGTYYSQGTAFATTSKEAGIRWYNKPVVVSGAAIFNRLQFETNSNGGPYGPQGYYSDEVTGGLFSFSTMNLAYVELITTSNITAFYTNCTSGTFTATLPVVGNVQSQFHIINTGAGTITVKGNGTDNITFGASTANTFTLAQGKWALVRQNTGSTQWYVMANN